MNYIDRNLERQNIANTFAEAKVLTHLEQKEYLKKIKEGDKNAREEFLLANSKLVLSIAQKYYGKSYTLEDLYQIGYIGLITAIDKFDLSKEYQFSTYAYTAIQNTIANYIANSDDLFKITNALKQDLIKLKKYLKSIGEDALQIPSINKLSEETGISKENLVFLINYIKPTFSLNSIISEEGNDTELMNFIVDDSLTRAEDEIYQSEKAVFISKALDYLKPIEKEVIKYRFGFYNNKIYRYEEITKLLGISTKQIKLVESKAIKILRMQGNLDNFKSEYESNRKI